MCTSSGSRRRFWFGRGWARCLSASLALWLALAPALAAGQTPVAEEAVRGLPEDGCVPEDFDPAGCAETISRLESLAKQDARRDDVQLALAQAYWNAAGDGEETGGGEEMRQRSLEIYRRLGGSSRGETRARALIEMSVRLKDDGERARLLQEVVALDPRNSAAFRDLGFVRLSQGRTDEALVAYRTALALGPAPSREEALTHLRFAQGLTDAGHAGDAVEILRTVVRPGPDVTRTERCLGMQPLDLEPFRGFPGFVSEVEGLRPYCNDLDHRDRAVELEREGRTAEAIEELEQQLRANPQYDETYFLLEALYRARGDMERAAEVLRLYFQREEDPAERCRRFRMLSIAARDALGPKLLEQLGQECQVALPKARGAREAREAREGSKGGGKWGWIAAAAVVAGAAVLLTRDKDAETSRFSGRLTGQHPFGSHPAGPFRDGICRAQLTWTGAGAVNLMVAASGSQTAIAQTPAGRGQGPPVPLEWACARGISYTLGVSAGSGDYAVRSTAAGGAIDYQITLVHPPSP